jgi:hypothetical protein
MIVAAAPGPPGSRVGGASPGAQGEVAERAAAPRPWPIDVSIHLSSSFGEYRDGHLHAGVDIRSFGREGIPCLAVDAGFVSRLRASPYGYGKAVYLKLASGETAVYAHLSEFSPALDSLVCAAQKAAGRYEVDLPVEAGRLPVRRGEVVGYTGSTGASAPHLHFEVRDGVENPVNPLDAGWTIEDHLPPTIRRVEWLPLSPDSRVEGRCGPRLVDLSAVDSNTYAARETLAVSGRVGISAQITDRLDSSSGRLAPYAVELELEGVVVCRVELMRFSYEHAQEVELAYDMTRARSKGQHFLHLFRRQGETLWNRDFSGDGVIDSELLESRSDGPRKVHTAVVRAVDKWGHVSTASLPFVISGSPAAGRILKGGTRERASDARGELPGCYFFEGMMSLRSAAGRGPGLPDGIDSLPRPQGAAFAGEADSILVLEEVERSGRTIELPGRGGPIGVYLFAARNDRRTTHEFGRAGAGLSIPAGSLYSNSLLYLAEWDTDVASAIPAGSGTYALTRAVRLGPVSVALKRPIEIRFACAGPFDGREAVFHYDLRRGLWSLRPSAARGDSVSASVREPGVYAVLADTLAPAIGSPQVRSRKSHALGTFASELVVSVVDSGCGVDAERTTVYLDGEKQIARWDGFSEKLFVLLGRQNIIGVRELAIVAVDRLGNSSKLSTRIRISPPALQDGAGGAR